MLIIIKSIFIAVSSDVPELHDCVCIKQL